MVSKVVFTKKNELFRALNYLQHAKSISFTTTLMTTGKKDELFRPPLDASSPMNEEILRMRKHDEFRNKLLGDGKRKRLKIELEVHKTYLEKQSDRVLWIAFGSNFADMCFKGVVAYLTGSRSIFAETIHNAMDTLNQGILILGAYFSKRKPDPDFPYGYGNMRYIASLFTGFGILSFGSGVSIFNGISGLIHPGVLESLYLAYISLAISACFQLTSFTAAVRQLKRSAAESHMPIFAYLQTTVDPTLNVILCEDSAGLTGVLIAFGAISLSHLLNSPFYDSMGSLLIGGLLGMTAIYIIRTNSLNLMGRSLPERRRELIVRMLKNDIVIKGVHDVKATSIGVNKFSFKAEIDYGGKEITRAYLMQDCDLTEMLKQVQSFNNEKQLEQFMLDHGEKIVDRLGDEVDRIEKNIKRADPDIGHIDLEPS